MIKITLGFESMILQGRILQCFVALCDDVVYSVNWVDFLIFK